MTCLHGVYSLDMKETMALFFTCPLTDGGTRAQVERGFCFLGMQMQVSKLSVKFENIFSPDSLHIFFFFKLLFLEFLLLTSSSNVNRNIEDEINLYCRIANFNNHLHDPSFDVIENRVRKNREIICLKKNSWSTISWAFLKARNFPEMYIGSKTERLYIENGFGSQKEFATSRYY